MWLKLKDFMVGKLRAFAGMNITCHRLTAKGGKIAPEEGLKMEKKTVYPRLSVETIRRRKDKYTEQVKAYYDKTRGEHTIPQVAEALGISEKAVANALYRLCSSQNPTVFPKGNEWLFWRINMRDKPFPETPFSNTTRFYARV